MLSLFLPCHFEESVTTVLETRYYTDSYSVLAPAFPYYFIEYVLYDGSKIRTPVLSYDDSVEYRTSVIQAFWDGVDHYPPPLLNGRFYNRYFLTRGNVYYTSLVIPILNVVTDVYSSPPCCVLDTIG